jgi:hypothetical protein
MPSEVDCITGTEFRLNNQSTFLMTLDNQGKLGLPWVYQINLQRHIVYGSFKLQYRVSMNGAATNNLLCQQMAVQPIPAEGYLVQEAGRTCRIF